MGMKNLAASAIGQIPDDGVTNIYFSNSAMLWIFGPFMAGTEWIGAYISFKL
jgi:hypothetical protein